MMPEVIAGMSMMLLILLTVTLVTLVAVRVMTYGAGNQQGGSNPILNSIGRSSSTIQVPPTCLNPKDEPLRSQCLTLAEGTSPPQLAQYPTNAPFTSTDLPSPLCWVTIPTSPLAGAAAEQTRRLECWHHDRGAEALVLSTFESLRSDAADMLSLQGAAPSDWGPANSITLGRNVVGVVWECYADGDSDPLCAPGEPVATVEMHLCMDTNASTSVGTGQIPLMCNNSSPEKFPPTLEGESQPMLLLAPGKI